MKKVVAAVGILRREGGAGDAIFLQCRTRENRFYPEHWEFPGGKVEAGESPAEAVRRELHEEVGVEVEQMMPWLCCEHLYDHALVTLHVFRVTRWHGEAASREGQAWRWWEVGAPPPLLLPASRVLWKWLALPPRCVVSAAEVIGTAETLARLPAVAAAPLLLQLRDKNLPPDERLQLAQAMAAQTQRGGGLLVVNDDEALARKVGAGVHLSSRRLMSCDARPPFEWVGASCHDAAQLARAAALELDYAVLSPVHKTLTHVAAAPIGWEGFAAFAARSPIPLYALGGMTPDDMETAQAHGAHGIAMMRQGWAAE